MALSRIILKNHLPPSIPPIPCRSTEDLERTVVHYLRSKRHSSQATTNQTDLKIKSSSLGPQGWFLVPGGRWLLGPGESHNLCCWDLSGESVVEWSELARARPSKDQTLYIGHINTFLFEDGSGVNFVTVRQALFVPPLPSTRCCIIVLTITPSGNVPRLLTSIV